MTSKVLKYIYYKIKNILAVDVLKDKINLYLDSKFIDKTHKRTNIPQECHLVIIPCDPFTVIGSRGDEAMIIASIQQFRESYPEGPVTFIVSSSYATDKLLSSPVGKNCNTIECWDGKYGVREIVSNIEDINPSDIVIIGADCMDGYYNPALSFTLLGSYIVLSKLCYAPKLLGFSFNSKPNNAVCTLFKKYPNLNYNLRDEDSLKRFEEFTHVGNGRLVADSAFMLIPDSKNSEYHNLLQWKQQIVKGNDTAKFIGFNIHPMLKKYKNEEDIAKDAEIIYDSLSKVLESDLNINLILLPHDDRPGINDGIMLKIIHDKLVENGFSSRVYYNRNVLHADEIKGVCTLLDGVVTSRMHLAIAALGMNIPVLTADYQDKFKGLVKHFNIPERFVLKSDDFFSRHLIESVRVFVANLQSLKRDISNQKEHVLSLSRKNFEE